MPKPIKNPNDNTITGTEMDETIDGGFSGRNGPNKNGKKSEEIFGLAGNDVIYGLGSGDIDERDAGDALKMSVGLIPVDLRADIDRDAEVTSRDATLIMQASRG